MNGFAAFLKSSIGAKTVMAITGIMLVGFVIAHLSGNLLIFSGDPETINSYAVWLRSLGAGLWFLRIGLILAVILHIASAIRLSMLNKAARPVAYQMTRPEVSSYASRTMAWSGVIVLAFIVYHLLHFTWGQVQPESYAWSGNEANVYAMVVAGFQVPAIAISYVVAIALLGMHLSHGLTSMFQSLGMNHPKYNDLIRKIGPVTATLYVLANISIPLSILMGWVQ
jgi:succinate dehydrogenase / fumarate reductase cytochrome b subunit